MPTRISLAESAVADLEDLRAWYVSQSAPDVGERVVREIVASLDQLAEFPESGRIVPEFEQPWLREFIRPPFRIVYRLEPERVRIVRVWRSERLMAGSTRATAVDAVASMQSRSAASHDKLSAADVENEIAAARKARRP
jgi:plasmid stabilization system protein ParE